MSIQQLSCNFKHLSMPIHLGPCQSNPSTPEPVGGGEAAPAARGQPVALRLGRPDGRRSVVAPPKGQASANSREDRPSRTTTGPWLWPLDAPVRTIGHGTKAVERGRSGREDAARGRRETGILKLKRAGPRRPAPLLFDSAR